MRPPTAKITATRRNDENPDGWDVTVMISDGQQAAEQTFWDVDGKTLAKWHKADALGLLEIKIG